jgi:hypothetical protein
MRVVVEARACSILRNLLTSMADPRGIFLLPANVCPVVPLTFLTVGRPFEFIDIDRSHLCMDHVLVDRRLAGSGPRVAGILYVRTYGALGKGVSEAFTAWKQSDPERIVIDDRCLSAPETQGTDLNGADAVLFSTGPSKYVDLGYGAYAHLAAGTNYDSTTYPFSLDHAARLTEFYERHIQLGSVIRRPENGADDLIAFRHWIPSRALSISNAEFFRTVSAYRDRVCEHKMRINHVYRREFGGASLGADYCNWRFQIRVPGKTTLLKRIFDAGHFASGHYYPASRLFGGGLCSNSEALYSEVVNLFNDFSVTLAQAIAVAEIVCRHLDDERPTEALTRC